MLNLYRARHILLFGVLCGLASGCNESRTPAARTPPTNPPSTTVTANRQEVPAEPGTKNVRKDPSNTGVNTRDRNPEKKTSFDQNENKTDIDITAEIRKQVVDTKMSVDAQNVKIITQDGRVTLRGPVATTDEKGRIDSMARSVAGAEKVDNQLEVIHE